MANVFKVLVAEDDPSLSRFITQVVARVDGVAFAARNGRIALEILEDNPDIKLLITDVIMPELGGVELMRILRSRPKYDSLVTIMMSGEVTFDDIYRLLNEGVTFFLPKPLSATDLRHYILRAMGLPGLSSMPIISGTSGQFPAVRPPPLPGVGTDLQLPSSEQTILVPEVAKAAGSRPPG
jgi:CheY-like chemotaxis protein